MICTPELEIASVQHTLPQMFNETYTYDPRGNRLTSLTENYTYNNLNQLAETSSHTFEYDADGCTLFRFNIIVIFEVLMKWSAGGE